MNGSDRLPLVVIGGGIAGISAAFEAQRLGTPAVVFEASARPGGLIDNFVVDGFRFDTAVHLSFATESEVREIFDRQPHHRHAPESLNFDHGFWLRHPVQNNLFPLPLDDKIRLIASFAKREERPIKTYEDWLRVQLGDAMAERWSLPYTEKYWSVPASRLGVDWIGKRIHSAPLDEVLRGAMTSETPNVYYAQEMRYPIEGGYKSFASEMIDQVEIRSGHRLVRLDPDRRECMFENGTRVEYKHLISTIPLPRLIELCTQVPQAVRNTAGTLFATEIDLISVGFSKPGVSPSLWFYIYDADIVAARAYSPDRKSPSNVPAGCSALQFEIYSSRERPQTLSSEELKSNIVAGVEKMGLATRDEILFVDHRRSPYANVVFDLGMEARRDLVLDWVRSQGLLPAGRFGEWAYLWSNQAMLSGFRAARLALT